MMSSRADTPGLAPSMPGLSADKRRQLRHAALIMVLPVIVYAAVRPLVSSSALALGIAGGIPILYSLVLGFARRRIDPIALVSALGFSLACAVSVVSGGSSLALKLHEAPITFGLGAVMLVAVLVRRPFPLGRLMHVPSPDSRVDSLLGATIGAFLVARALLNVVLAVSLSTSSYLVVSRIVDVGTVVIGLVIVRIAASATSSAVPMRRACRS